MPLYIHVCIYVYVHICICISKDRNKPEYEPPNLVGCHSLIAAQHIRINSDTAISQLPLCCCECHTTTHLYSIHILQVVIFRGNYKTMRHGERVSYTVMHINILLSWIHCGAFTKCEIACVKKSGWMSLLFDTHNHTYMHILYINMIWLRHSVTCTLFLRNCVFTELPKCRISCTPADVRTCIQSGNIADV